MELRHLHYFVTVAEELSFTRAARVLRMSQPPLSQQIALLEKELGVRLFDRTSRRVELTDSGRVLLAEAHGILARAGELRQIAAGGAARRPLRLGSVPSGFTEVLPAVIPAFRARHPGVTLLVSAQDVADQVHALVRGELDLGVLRATGPVEGVELATIAEEPLVVVLPAGHPLAALPAVELALLASEDFLVMPRRQAPDYVDLITSSCLAAGFSPRIAHEPSTDQIMLGMVACGLGVALVPRPAARLTMPEVVTRPLAGPTPMTTLALAQPVGRPCAHFAAVLDLALAAAR